MSKSYSKVFSFVSIFAFITVSHAQDKEPPLDDLYELDDIVASVEEIIVTANRRQEMLQDVPLSIAAFTEEFFKDTGLTEFKSLADYTASLRITGGANSRNTGIRIRGIGTSGFNAGIDPSVGVFIDGIYQGRAGMSLGDFLDIERVEVLRGPQGSLYGKNTAAGAISIISKQPGFMLEGKGEVVLTNYNGREFRGMLNVPFDSENSASAMRMAGYVVRRDGYDDNVTTDKEINDANKWGFKARTYIDLEENNLGAITVSLDASKEDADCCAPDIISSTGPSTFEDAISLDALRADPTLNPPLVIPKDDPFDQKVATNDDFLNDVEVNGVAVEWSIDTENDFIYTWTNAHRHYEMISELDGDFTPFDGIAALVDVNLDQVSSEFRVAAPEGETIDYQLGLYYYHSIMRTIDTFIMKSDLGSRLGGGALLLLNPTGSYTNVGNNLHKTTTYAIFGQATWNITDDISATLGGRFTKEKKDRTGSQKTSPEYPPPGIEEGSPFAPEFPPLVGYSVDILPGENTFTQHNFSPTLSLRYHQRQKLMYYASVSRGFKSGGFNATRVLRDVSTQFDDEISTNYEIGWKGTWLDDKLQLNGTFYYIDYTDFQAQTWDGVSLAVRNAGRLESKGLELELIYVHSLDLMMGASLAYNHSEYKEFEGGECTVPETKRLAEYQIANDLPGEVCSKDLTGQVLDNAPQLTATPYLSYSRPFTGNKPFFWFARLEYMYTSSFYHALDLDPNLKNDATQIINIRLGIGNLKETWDVTLWSRNITDEGNLVLAADTTAVGGYAGWTAPPRTIGLTLKFNF